MPIGLDAVLNDKNFQDGLRRYENGLNQMEKSTDHTANVLTRIGSVMQGAVVAGLGAMTVAVGGFVAASKVGLDTTLQWAEGLDKLGDQFGLSGEKASGFQFLAEKVGLSVDEMGMGLNALTRGLADMKNAQGSNNLVTAKSSDAINGLKDRLADANTKLERAKKNLSEAKKPTDAMRYAVEDAQKAVSRLNADIAGATKLVPKAEEKESDFAKALKSLGVSAFNAKGKLKTFDEILPQIMDAFEKLPAGVKSSDLAMQLFGARGGSKFLDFLRQGSKGLTEAQKKAKLLGLQLSTEEVNAAEEFGFAVNELNLGLKGLWNQIGRQVLPVARQFVDFLNNRVIPVLARIVEKYAPAFGRVLQFAFNALDTLTTGLAGNWQPFAELMDKTFGREMANNIGNLINAFFGVRDAIVGIVQAFQSGGLSGGLQSIGDALAKAVGNIDWNKVQAQLSTWKDQFWNWLTGKGGAIEQVSAQLGKVVTEIAKWAKDNAPDWLKILETWKTDFWNWLTNKDSGVLVTVADNMQKLSDMILEWANDSKTQKQFEEIGKQVANDVIDGMGRIFENPDEGDALISRLWRMMVRTAQNWSDSFARIGGSIAQGVFTGIISRFTDDETAQRIAGGIGQAFNNAISIMTSPGGWVQNLVSRFVTSFVNQLQATLNEYLPQLRISVPNPFGSTPTPQPTPLGTAGGAAGSAGASLGRSFASGGWVPFDMQAMIHAGEYVLNRQQARAFAPMLAGANNSRTYNFNNTWNGNASAIDRGELARIAEDSAYRGIQRAMRGT